MSRRLTILAGSGALVPEVISRARAAGDAVQLVDSAAETALAVEKLLDARGLRSGQDTGGTHRFLVSDAPENTVRVGERFLGRSLNTVEWVDF